MSADMFLFLFFVSLFWLKRNSEILRNFQWNFFPEKDIMKASIKLHGGISNEKEQTYQNASGICDGGSDAVYDSCVSIDA